MTSYIIEIMNGGVVLEQFNVEREKPPIQFAQGKLKRWQNRLQADPTLLKQFNVKHTAFLTYRMEQRRTQ